MRFFEDKNFINDPRTFLTLKGNIKIERSSQRSFNRDIGDVIKRNEMYVHGYVTNILLDCKKLMYKDNVPYRVRTIMPSYSVLDLFGEEKDSVIKPNKSRE